MKVIKFHDNFKGKLISEIKKNESFLFSYEHLSFKALSQRESELMRCLRNREENRIYFFHSEIITQDMQHKWYAKYLEDNTQFMIAVYETENEDKLIGFAGIYDIIEGNSAEIGRLLTDSKSCSVRGTGGLICNALSEVCFEQFGLRRLYAYIQKRNERSINSFLKAGYQYNLDYEDPVCMERLAFTETDII